MPVDKDKIQIGQLDIWVGGTAPTAGTDPNDPTAGTPSALNAMTTGFAAPTSGGAYVGATSGAATFTYRPTFYNVMIEQAFAEVVTTPQAEECSLAFTAVELTYQNIQTAYGQTKTRVSGSDSVNYGGGLNTVSPKVVAGLQRKRSGTGYFLLTLYQAYSSEGAATNFERRAETRLPVTLRGLADASRPIGDQLFQFVEYAANPA